MRTKSCVPRFGGKSLLYKSAVLAVSTIRTRTLNFVTLLAFRRFLAAEFCLDEVVDLAVHDFLHVARFGAGAVVFDHLIRLKNVGTNLVAPGDLALLAVLPVDLGAF